MTADGTSPVAPDTGATNPAPQATSSPGAGVSAAATLTPGGASQPTPGAPAAQPPPVLRCPSCGTPLADDQNWCLQCGVPARTRIVRATRWQTPILVAGLVILLSLGGLVFAFVRLTSNSSPPSHSAAPVRTPAPAPAPAPAVPAVPTGQSGTTGAPAGTAPAGSTGSAGAATTGAATGGQATNPTSTPGGAGGAAAPGGR